MTDSDDKLARRYRELPREEPSAELDDAILAASRRAVASRPRSNWMVPASIAAVLVLGIGVSLRMQMEQPGVETSVPSSSSAEYPLPAAEPPPPPKPQAQAQSQPAPEAAPPAKPAAKPAAKPLEKEAKVHAPSGVSEEKRKEAAEALADAPIVLQSPVPASPPVEILAAPRVQATAPAAASAPPQPAAAAAPAPRAKREAFAADSAAASGARALGAVAEADPARELERIARLREAGRHEEADRALAEFRRRLPDYRIPEAVWERVKPPR